MRPVNTPSNFRSFHLPDAYTRPRTFHPLLTSEPIAVSISDGQRISGHGFGFDYTSHLKAKGEYLERFITLRAVPYTHRAVIKDMAMTPEAQNSVLRAISETCSDKNLLRNLKHHPFRTVNACNLLTQAPAQLPWIFFSLHTHEDCLDCSYVPIRDTSGSAFHTNETRAREAALLEFIERQNLTAMWAARRCLSQYTLHADTIEDPQSRTLVALLEKKGVLTVYDISFIKGVTSIFITYKAKSPEDYVQFSCGASAALNPQDALKKAIIETWQTGLLLLQMPVFKEKDYGGDELKEAFQKANYHSFDLGVETIPEERVVHAMESSSLKTAILSLAEVSPHIFFYQQPYRSGNDCGFFCKIFSPDFFVHMNPGEGNNNRNLWVKKIAQSRGLRLETMPFS